MPESIQRPSDPGPLVSSARQGCDEALARLFERHRETLGGFVSSRLGSRLRSRIEAEDILQEVFLLASRSPSRVELRDERGFVTWTLRIAENYIRKIARDWAPKKRPRRRSTLSPLALEGFGPEEPATVVRRSPERVDEELLFLLARSEEFRSIESDERGPTDR